MIAREPSRRGAPERAEGARGAPRRPEAAPDAAAGTTRAGGEAAGFESLLLPVLPRAYSAALHLTRDECDAEDLVQEATLMALRGFRTFQPGTHFRAWFLKVLHNAFLMRCRRESRRTGDVALDELGERTLLPRLSEAGLVREDGDPAGEFFSRMDSARVGEAIRALPLEYRAVAGLYFSEDLSYAEIADIVGCPVGTVRSRLHRARGLLQQTLWEVAVEHGLVPARARPGAGADPRATAGPAAAPRAVAAAASGGQSQSRA